MKDFVRIDLIYMPGAAGLANLKSDAALFGFIPDRSFITKSTSFFASPQLQKFTVLEFQCAASLSLRPCPWYFQPSGSAIRSHVCLALNVPTRF